MSCSTRKTRRLVVVGYSVLVPYPAKRPAPPKGPKGQQAKDA